MSAQVAGILLGVFSVVVSVALYYGAFAEQKRVEKDLAASRKR